MFIFIVKTSDGIGSREVVAYNVEECLVKLGLFDNAEFDFIPYMNRKKYKDLIWNVTVKSSTHGHDSRYQIRIKQ